MTDAIFEARQSHPLDAVEGQEFDAMSTRVATYAAILAYGLVLAWVVISLLGPVANG
jgi:hypothetical protein